MQFFMSKQTTQSEDWLVKWSEKYGVPVKTLQGKYNKALEETKELLPDLSEDEAAKRSRMKVRNEMKRIALSTSALFRGVVVGVSPPNQVYRRKYNAAKEYYDQDPQKAVEEGVCNVKGTPLDQNEYYSTGRRNPGYRKPLDLDRYIFNVVGVAGQVPLDGDEEMELKAFTMLVGGDLANPKKENFLGDQIPLFKAVEFRGISKESNGSLLKMNHSNLTKFEIWEKPNLPSLGELLNDILKEQYIDIKDLGGWQKQHATDWGNFVLFNCDALQIDPNPTQFDTWVLHVTDETILDDDIDAIKSYVPLYIPVDFGVDSRLLVCGRPSLGGPNQRLQMNIYGILAYPKFRYPAPKVDRVTKKSTDMDDSEKGEGEDLPLSTKDFRDE
jgi:hypothetical protein